MTNTCIIIDDEPVAIEVIKTHLQQLEDFDVKAAFTNPIKAAGYLRENQRLIVTTPNRVSMYFLVRRLRRYV